jgi:hypothetical protein
MVASTPSVKKKMPDCEYSLPCIYEKTKKGRCRLSKSPLPVAIRIKRWCEEGSANGQPLLRVVAVSYFSLLVQNVASHRHLLNMPSSQPRSPPPMLPLPRLPISGSRGAGLCATCTGAEICAFLTDVWWSSFTLFALSAIVAGRSSDTTSKSPLPLNMNMLLLRLNQLPDLARGRACGVMVWPEAGRLNDSA